MRSRDFLKELVPAVIKKSSPLKTLDTVPVPTSPDAQAQSAPKAKFQFSRKEQDVTDISPKEKKSIGTATPIEQKPQVPRASDTDAPSIGQPVAQQRLAKLAADAASANVQKQAKEKPQGFFAGLSQGFKQGMGMDPDQSLAKGVASAALNKVGMRNTAAAVIDPRMEPDQDPQQNKQPGQEPSAGPSQVPQQKLPTPGSMIRDPRFGYVKVLPNAPGQRGIKLDTTKKLGHPIIIDPDDLQR